MRPIFLFLIIIVFTSSGYSQKNSNKEWLGKRPLLERLDEVVNRYHMFDSTGAKVGSMVFGFDFVDNMLVARDTSQLDNGSVYETAEFVFDTTSFAMKTANIVMKFGKTQLDVSLQKNNKRVTGTYTVSRDTVRKQTNVDSAYSHDIFREELYILLHSLEFNSGDTLTFSALVPTSMTVSQASLSYVGDEKVTVPHGTYNCTVLWLKTDGNMPANKIWISREEPWRAIKYYVPGPELTIELVSTK